MERNTGTNPAAQLLPGIAAAIFVGGLAIWGLVIEIGNNYAFGLMIGTQAAWGAVLVALMVAVIPSIAAFRGGWTAWTGWPMGLMVALSFTASAMNYGAGGGAIISTSASVKGEIASATAAKARAEAMMAAQASYGDPAQLDDALKSAESARKAECGHRDKWRGLIIKCDEAIRAQDEASRRLGSTKAYKEAEADLKAADARLRAALADKEGAKVSHNVIVASAANVLKMEQDTLWSGLLLGYEMGLILAMLYAASKLGDAVAMLLAAVNEYRAAQPKGRKGKGRESQTPPNNGGTRIEEDAANVYHLDKHRGPVKAWMGQKTAEGGRMLGGDALRSFRAWARRHAPAAATIGSDELKAALRGLLGEAAIDERTSGYSVSGRSLRGGKAAGAQAMAI